MTHVLSSLLVLAMIAASASADTVTLSGSVIPLKGCTIRDVKSGRLYLADARGRRQWRELEEVERLGFDGLPQLDAAEDAFAEGDTDAGIRGLLQALVVTDDEVKRLWIRVRLANAHDDRGEFTQSAGHVAAVFLLRDDPYWQRLEPRAVPDRPPFAAVQETYTLLREADRAVQSRPLAAIVDRLLEKVRPLHETASAAYEGPPIAPRSTISGVPRGQIRSGRFRLEQSGPPVTGASPPSPPAAGGRGERSAGPGRAATDPRRPAAAPPPTGGGPSVRPEQIDRLLAEARAEEALRLCEQVAVRPDDRNVARLLHQYGLALSAAGHRREAAVMFMRAAILFESSAYAVPSLLETAVIYRTEYRKPAIARRLAERALDAAALQGQADVAARARDLIALVDSSRRE